MADVGQIFEYLNELAPVELKMDFDNVGLLVGNADDKVDKCLVALDITDEVIEEAVRLGAQLIVSHHPIIFGAIKSVTAEDLVGRKIIALIRNDISAICMHTNLDIAEGGVNDVLMSALKAKTLGYLEACGVDAAGTSVGCGRMGELETSMRFEDFLTLCKTALNANGLRYHYAGKPVKNSQLWVEQAVQASWMQSLPAAIPMLRPILNTTASLTQRSLASILLTPITSVQKMLWCRCLRISLPADLKM